MSNITINQLSKKKCSELEGLKFGIIEQPILYTEIKNKISFECSNFEINLLHSDLEKRYHSDLDGLYFTSMYNPLKSNNIGLKNLKFISSLSYYPNKLTIIDTYYIKNNI